MRPISLAVACLALLGCAVTRQMLTVPDDLADYRAYRGATQEGTRLATAQRYLDRHPHGAWAAELRRTFEAEEAAWFESAKVSRSLARDYLVDLPNGPHAAAARALLLLFDERYEDIDTLELLAAARRTEAMLDVESEHRKRIGETILGELAALLDPPTWGSRLDDPPAVLAETLRGPTPRTWGGATSGRRVDELFFVIPTPEGAQGRAVEVRFQLVLSSGRVAEGWIQGEDMFLRWAEANYLRVLDPTSPTDREAAASAVADVLAGALETRMPATRCTAAPSPGDLVSRQCEGWQAVATMGARAGQNDAVVIRGPLLDGAHSTGMR
jgi:hypothetical protein